MSEGAESLPTLRLGEILIERGIISQEQLGNSLRLQRETGARLGMALVQLGYATPDQIADSLAWQEAFGSSAVSQLDPDPSVEGLLTEEFCRVRQVLPVGFNESQALIVAMVNPADIVTLEEIGLFTGLEVTPLAATPGGLLKALDSVYPSEDGLEQLAGQDTFLPLLEEILAVAVRRRASHVHFEALEDHMVVRLRVDGVLHHLTDIRKEIKTGVVSHLKIMAQLDIAQQRLPQDGRATFKSDGRTIGLRIVCLPTVFGESLTIRLLDGEAGRISVNELGMGERELSVVMAALLRSKGQIVVAGPSGSGKSTTLLSVLEELRSPRLKICSVADSIERVIPDVLQIQTRRSIGLTSAAITRALLESDPDILALDGVDDPDTAIIAGDAALSGRLVLATLHTEDAASAIVRLLEMGVPAYIVASSLACVLAQRLVRKLCVRCKELVTLTREYMTEKEYAFLGQHEATVARAKGCAFCLNTGYSGRIGLFEVLPISQVMQQLILSGATVREIRDQARSMCVPSLREDGRLKVLAGLTSIEEVEHATF